MDLNTNGAGGSSETSHGRLWIYTVLPAILLNAGAVAIYGLYYGLLQAKPGVAGTIPQGYPRMALDLLVISVEWGLTVALFLRLRKEGNYLFKLILPGDRPWRFRILPALGTALLLNLLFAAYLYIASLLYGDLGKAYDGLPLFIRILQILLIPATAAFCEELLWRGYILTQLEVRGYPPWASLMLMSLSFAAIHGILLPDRLLATFLFGIITGVYYRKERNLIPLMAMHWVLDVWSYGILIFKQKI